MVNIYGKRKNIVQGTTCGIYFHFQYFRDHVPIEIRKKYKLTTGNKDYIKYKEIVYCICEVIVFFLLKGSKVTLGKGFGSFEIQRRVIDFSDSNNCKPIYRGKSMKLLKKTVSSFMKKHKRDPNDEELSKMRKDTRIYNLDRQETISLYWIKRNGTNKHLKHYCIRFVRSQMVRNRRFFRYRKDVYKYIDKT